MKTYQETITEMNELVTDSFRQLSDLNTRAYDSLVKGQTEMANMVVRAGVKQMELVRDVKDVPSYITAQKELTQEITEELVQYTQSSVEIATSNRDELFGWVESSLRSATKINPLTDSKAA